MSAMSSLWAQFATWLASAAETASGASAAATTISKDVAAFDDAVKFFKDLAANKATISEGLSAGLAADQILEPYLPGATYVADEIELLQAASALYGALPAGLQIIKAEGDKPVAPEYRHAPLI